METSYDIIIIGAGIAGASLAGELAQQRKVLLLEREDHAGYHATGRSAAIYLPSYGPPVIQALTKASGDFFHNTPDGFCQTPLLSPRPMMMIAKQDDDDHIAEAMEAGMKKVPFAQALNLIPCLNARIYNQALVDNQTCDIDVDILLQAYLKKFRRDGGVLLQRAEVTGISKNSDGWTINCRDQIFSAPVIVNAAGAWADNIAKLAGLSECGLEPKRRSAALIDISDHTPDCRDVSNWPLTVGAGNTFYFRPMGGKLMVSPADETITEPHDAWADDMALAGAMELLHEAIGYEVTRLEHSWAGLRTFAPDGDPVVGFDPEASGFFWLAGQGGYGIQTSPALSKFAAAQILQQDIPSDIKNFHIDKDTMSPARFETTGSGS